MAYLVNGIQRSGTNYTIATLSRNYSQEFIDFDSIFWKHQIYTDNIGRNVNDLKLRKPTKIITVVKNPYKWVESICFNNSVDIVTVFSEYNLLDRNNVVGVFGINLKKLLLLYKDFYTSWETYGTIRIRYEDLLKENTLQKAINPILGEPITPKIDFPKIVKQSKDFKKEHIRQYLRYETTKLSRENINTITQELTPEFINKLGYSVK